jgi:hypothetical protein
MSTHAAADTIEVFEAHEHRDLALGLAQMAETIETATDLTPDALRARLRIAQAWLARDVLPHITWEETFLYPMMDQVAGTSWATRSARLEHRQIEAWSRRSRPTASGG